MQPLSCSHQSQRFVIGAATRQIASPQVDRNHEKMKSLIGFVTDRCFHFLSGDAIPGDSNLTHLPTSTVNRARKKRREKSS